MVLQRPLRASRLSPTSSQVSHVNPGSVFDNHRVSTQRQGWAVSWGRVQNCLNVGSALKYLKDMKPKRQIITSWVNSRQWNYGSHETMLLRTPCMLHTGKTMRSQEGLCQSLPLAGQENCKIWGRPRVRTPARLNGESAIHSVFCPGRLAPSLGRPCCTMGRVLGRSLYTDVGSRCKEPWIKRAWSFS